MEVLHHSCGFVVFFENDFCREYLLLRYPEGHIDLVKGHKEGEESELVTAKRELEEETGISEIEVFSPFFMSINYEYKRKNEHHKKKVDFFLGKVDSKSVKISHEHTDFIWLPYNDAVSKITFDNARDVLIAAESFLSLL